MILFIAIICAFCMVTHKGISQEIWKLIDLKHNPCEGNFTLYNNYYKLCYTVIELSQMPIWTDDQCSIIDKTNSSAVYETKILDKWMFYWIFDSLKKEKPAFSNGSVEVLIGVTYRRGDGFRWRDGTAPNDLSFLKFNPIDNLDDEDNLVENYCLRFSIIVDKNAKDGYGTKWYECDRKDSMDYKKKLFYQICSYSKDDGIQETDQKSKQKNCRRNEITVKIDDTYLCYVHIVNNYLMDNVSDINNSCHQYSNEYEHETERWNQLSPAAVPNKNLLQLLHEEIVSVHRQFERRNHGLMIGLNYINNKYQWEDGISIVRPSLENLIAGQPADEDCYHFMLFQSVPDYMVPVPCSDKAITYDILCKYILGKESDITKNELLDEIKTLVDQKSESSAINSHSKFVKFNLLAALFFTLLTAGVISIRENRNNG